VTCGDTCAYGRCVTTIALSPYDTLSLAVDGTNIYWTGDEDLYSAPLTGGAVTTLGIPSAAPGFRPALAIDATNVYWTGCTPTESGAVFVTPLAGGTTTTLATAGNVATGIVVDEANVYWKSSAGVLSVPKAGGTPTTLVSGGSGDYAIAVDSSYVYWSNSSYVYEVPKAGGAVALVSPVGFVDFLALSGTSLAWGGQGQAGVVSLGVDGGAPEFLAWVSWADDSMSPQQVATDGVSLYAETFPGLMKISLATGAVTYLSRADPSGHSAIAIDATSVYWATNGTIQRVTPR
jgi:hypothetical protein